MIFASSADGRLREPRRRLRIRFSRRSEAGLRRRPRRTPNPIFASSSGARIRFLDRSRPPNSDFRVKFRGSAIFRSNGFDPKIRRRRERVPNDAKIIFASSSGCGGRHRRSSPRKPRDAPRSASATATGSAGRRRRMNRLRPTLSDADVAAAEARPVRAARRGTAWPRPGGESAADRQRPRRTRPVEPAAATGQESRSTPCGRRGPAHSQARRAAMGASRRLTRRGRRGTS